MAAETDRLRLPASLDELATARRWVREHADRAGFDDRALGEIDLAVTEAVSNVVRHAYDGNDAQHLELDVTVDGPELVIVLLDQGKAPEGLPEGDPDFDNPGPGGYGLYLIRTVMDEVERSSGPEGNTLRLVRRRDR